MRDFSKNTAGVTIDHIWVAIDSYKWLIDRDIELPPGSEMTCTIVNGIYKECRGSGNSGSQGLNNAPNWITPGNIYKITIIAQFANGEKRT